MRPRALLAAALLLAGPAAAQDLALVGATLYDGTGGPPLESAVVVVEAGRVACVGTAAECPVPPAVEARDLAGRYLAPGLVDAHVHTNQTGWLDGRPDSGIGTDRYDYAALQRALRADPGRWDRAYLCAGVTAVFDVGGPMWTLGVEAVAEGEPGRVRFRAAGPLITAYAPVLPLFAVDGDNTFLPMGSEEEAAAGVEALAAGGARAVKVWFIDPPEGEREAHLARLERVGAEARAAGLPLIVHATELENAKAALRAGASMLVHSVGDAPVDSAFVALALEAGAVYAPTLTVGANWRRAVASVLLGETAEIDDPNGCVDAATRAKIADAPALQAQVPEARRDAAAVEAMLEDAAQGLALMQANLRRVHEAGVPVATATDAGNPLTLHGPSIYAEMEAMEAAGIAPAEVLVLSTRGGARALGLDGEIGVVAPGARADLVVLAADPGASTRAFRSVTHVVRDGAVRPVEALAAE